MRILWEELPKILPATKSMEDICSAETASKHDNGENKSKKDVYIYAENAWIVGYLLIFLVHVQVLARVVEYKLNAINISIAFAFLLISALIAVVCFICRVLQWKTYVRMIEEYTVIITLIIFTIANLLSSGCFSPITFLSISATDISYSMISAFLLPVLYSSFTTSSYRVAILLTVLASLLCHIFLVIYYYIYYQIDLLFPLLVSICMIYLSFLHQINDRIQHQPPSADQQQPQAASSGRQPLGEGVIMSPPTSFIINNNHNNNNNNHNKPLTSSLMDHLKCNQRTLITNLQVDTGTSSASLHRTGSNSLQRQQLLLPYPSSSSSIAAATPRTLLRNTNAATALLVSTTVTATTDQPQQPGGVTSSSQKGLNSQIILLVANIAHDLKTPLGAIAYNIETLETAVETLKLQSQFLHGHAQHPSASSSVKAAGQESISFAEIDEIIEDMRSTKDFMFAAINRTQDYAKLSQGIKLSPSLETLNVMETLQHAIKLFGRKNLQDRVKLPTAYPHNRLCPFIITDKQWLQENIMCLISNAAKYSGTSSMIEIEIACIAPSIAEAAVATAASGSASFITADSSEGSSLPNNNNNNHNNNNSNNSKLMSTSMICFTVHDMGIGIPEDKRLALFAPFNKAQSHANGGTGLGLYSLAQRLEALGGSYGVNGRNDGKRGSSFWFAFPHRPDATSIEEVIQQRRASIANLLASTAVTSLAAHLSAVSTDQADLNAAAAISSAYHITTAHANSPRHLLAVRKRSSCAMRYSSELMQTQTQMVCEIGPHQSRILLSTTASFLVEEQSSSIHVAQHKAIVEDGKVAMDTSNHSHHSHNSSAVSSHSHNKQHNNAVRTTAATATVSRNSILSTSTAQQQQQQQPSLLPLRGSQNMTLPAKAMNILLVDDSIPILKIMRRTLRATGYTIDEVYNGLEAVEAIESQPFKYHMVIMDLHMPVLDGLEAIRTIRSWYEQLAEQLPSTAAEGQHQQRQPPLYIIGCSADSDDQTQSDFLEAGADGFIIKPFTLATFAVILSALGITSSCSASASTVS